MKVFYSSSILAMLFSVLLVEASQANDRKLLNVISVTGDCLKLVIEGYSHSCKDYLMQTAYDDGRIGFYFVSDADKGKIVTFSGLGQQQAVVSDNSRLQPIDGVIGKAGIIEVEGECFFENPFIGPARIECAAKSDGGGIYSANFRTNGEAPGIKNVEE
jgi:hypothetical protein